MRRRTPTSLSWRLALVDTADRSLDIRYHLWYGNPSGMILLAHVLEAADSGIRIRILVDDTLYVKGKSALAKLAAHPNIEIRLFNPWASAGVSRVFEKLAAPVLYARSGTARWAFGLPH